MKPAAGIGIAVGTLLVLIIVVVCCCMFIKKAIVSMPSYDIEVYDDVFTPEECARIRNTAQPQLFESEVYSLKQDVLDPSSRISEQCWLDTAETRMVRERIRPYLPRLSVKAHLELLQVVRYKPGGFFQPHYDVCTESRYECQRMDQPNGPRYITVLIYLSDVDSHGLTGGETVFPLINKSVTPKMGRMVIFYNIDASQKVIQEALHGGQPVISGEKWIANQWIHVG